MRLFAALDLDAAARRAVAEVQGAVRSALDTDLRWVSSDQMHLTLVFLGDVPTFRVDGIVASLSKPWPQPPFDILFAGLGVFPLRGAPRALWMGIREGEANLQALQLEIANRAASVHRDAAPGRFRPHLTLARFRRSRPADGRAVRDLAPIEPGIRQRIDHVTLYESVLSSGPPRYRQLARANLTSL
jgi:RNA 2',3'-cyclic 3'-phosphodiesterase